MLQQLNEIPSGMLDCAAHELHALLSGPTLIHLEGRRSPALFVSVLMHGNETTGWDAVRALLSKYYHGTNAQRPRSLSLFIANTAAAAKRVRHLSSQPDFNRVWPGSTLAPTPEHVMMQTVYNEMRQRGVFASVDVHNNTGLNPHYACVNTLNAATLKLATLFARTVVYFIRPEGVQSIAMSSLCPSVTLECGKPEQRLGTEHALTYLEACIHLTQIPKSPVPEHDIDLFHTTAIVKVPKTVSFGFDNSNVNLNLHPQIDHYNFRVLPAGTSFGSVRDIDHNVVSVTNECGLNVEDEYFSLTEGELLTKRVVMPSMLTRNLDVIRQDCLCYLMERYEVPETSCKSAGSI